MWFFSFATPRFRVGCWIIRSRAVSVQCTMSNITILSVKYDLMLHMGHFYMTNIPKYREFIKWWNFNCVISTVKTFDLNLISDLKWITEIIARTIGITGSKSVSTSAQFLIWIAIKFFPVTKDNQCTKSGFTSRITAFLLL